MLIKIANDRGLIFGNYLSSKWHPHMSVHSWFFEADEGKEVPFILHFQTAIPYKEKYTLIQCII